ncbi:polyprenol phosphomannose-dependent alpha 1,6 mannosyltransferase MptB [Nesterenkonia pannonica]|uniref:polyprenol phosphomannose-dependent alpha 1,6 mannosyltransferase MptB n=1 Tax=Nesterenkonia pannonica TaxID=1548602 RepID=UPI002164C90C|nr:polyprenol phosphomannose-dependent alpha 1,6 mannosyltransferase MptB [Nesterenkonia pannonica]
MLFAIGLAQGYGFGWVEVMVSTGTGAVFWSPVGIADGLLSGVLSNLGLTHYWTLDTLQLIGRLTSILVVLWLMFRGRDDRITQRMMWAFTALVVFSPIIQPWYLLWLLPLFAITGIRSNWQLKWVAFTVAFFLTFGAADQLSIHQFLGLDQQMEMLSLAISYTCLVVLALVDPGTRWLIWTGWRHRSLPPIRPGSTPSWESLRRDARPPAAPARSTPARVQCLTDGSTRRPDPSRPWAPQRAAGVPDHARRQRPEAMDERISAHPMAHRRTRGPGVPHHAPRPPGLPDDHGRLVGGWIPMHAAVAVHPAVLPLRTTDEGAITSAILLVIGALLLMRSWLRLVQRIDIRGPQAVPAMRKALIMWSAPMLLCLPIFSRDVYSYMAQGRVLHAGLNPYESGVSELPGWYAEGADGLWAESPSPYGPLFLLIAQTVWYATDGSPELGILAFRALSVLGVILMVTYIPKLASAFGARPAWAIWLCLLNPLSLIVFIPAAHNDPLMIGLVLASAWYALRRRRLAAVLLITAAVAVKPIAMVLLPFIVLLALPDTRSYLLRIREWAFGGGLSGALLIGGDWPSEWAWDGSPPPSPQDPP